MIHARVIGNLQWVCPACHDIQGHVSVRWRKGRISCLACHASYVLGIGFRSVGGGFPPFNALLSPDPWAFGESNRLFTKPCTLVSYLMAIARYTGKLDWSCPDCTFPQHGTPIENGLSSVTCSGCSHTFYLAPIFYRSRVGGAHVRSPKDWILSPFSHFSHETDQPIPPSGDGTLSAPPDPLPGENR